MLIKEIERFDKICKISREATKTKKKQQLNLKTNIFGYSKSVVLYVDPYDFGTVHIPAIHEILENHYCELIFNFFISDYVRNWNNNQDRIKSCLGGNLVDTKEELIEYVNTLNKFKDGGLSDKQKQEIEEIIHQ